MYGETEVPSQMSPLNKDLPPDGDIEVPSQMSPLNKDLPPDAQQLPSLAEGQAYIDYLKLSHIHRYGHIYFLKLSHSVRKT